MFDVGPWTSVHGSVALSAAIVVVLLAGCAGEPPLPEPEKPANIVILFADDLGYGSVSWTGGDIATPNIDSIVENGVGFTAGYMTAPVCNPSRHGLMTGRYQQRWGKEMNSQTVPPLGSPTSGSLPLAETTMATALKQRGYATAAVGKWQLGMAKGYHPLDRGFDSFLGMASGHRYVEADWPNARFAPGHEQASQATAGPRQFFEGREETPFDEYLTDKLGGRGVEFIDEHKDEPFFLYLAFHAPHTPIQTIDRYYDMVPQFEDETLRVYAGMITAVDHWVGEVLAKLRQHGLEENTLVLFASDNGAAAPADVDGRRNHPLLGNKRNLYGGGIRVPYAMQWKGRIPGGQHYEHPVSSMDMFPTAIAAARGEALGNLDGVNLLPYLNGSAQGAPHEHLVWRSGHNGAVRKGPWKLLVSGDELVRLYNVEDDIGESNDLSAQNPEVVEEMKKIFIEWTKDKDDPRESARKVKTKFNGDIIDWHI